MNGRGVGDWNPGRPMATPAETVDAYCVDWCKARCEALGADAHEIRQLTGHFEELSNERAEIARTRRRAMAAIETELEAGANPVHVQ